MVYLKRLNELIIKAISIKGTVFALSTWLLMQDKIDATTWWLSALLIVGGRAVEKLRN